MNVTAEYRKRINNLATNHGKWVNIHSPWIAGIDLNRGFALDDPTREVSPAVRLESGARTAAQWYLNDADGEVDIERSLAGRIHTRERLTVNLTGSLMTCPMIMLDEFDPTIVAMRHLLEMVSANATSIMRWNYTITPLGNAADGATTGPVDTTEFDYKWYISNAQQFAECMASWDGPLLGMTGKFFRKVLNPLHLSHAAFLDYDFETALEQAAACAWPDWSVAQTNWLESRR